MPAILNWLLRLVLTNPICMRLVQGGSRRMRHMYIRSGYLAVMIVVLLFVLLGRVSQGSSLSMRELAAGGAAMFQRVSYFQVGLICLLTPIFMAGAIAQEANPRTWDILLTTPLNSLQVVLGNLFGRLFFVVALLFSSLPLFAVTQYFGGVPGDSILASYAIAGTSALLVAAIAVTLSVTRTAGRRAVFLFYITVIMYLFATFALDQYLRLRPAYIVTAGSDATYTTPLTPLNPFLALEVLLRSNMYVVHDLTAAEAGWMKRQWMGRPIATFCWLCTVISVVLIVFSTLRLRVIGSKAGTVPWYRRLLGLAGRSARSRAPRHVATNPVAWREASNRGRTVGAIVARWGFVLLGIALALVIVTMFHTGLMNQAGLRLAVVSILCAEVVIIALVAINMSATAVSREREDGTLDLILTTPIQPGPYIAGKLRGLIQYLVPMMLVPTATACIIALYMLFGGFGRAGGIMVSDPNPAGTGTFPPMVPVLPEVAIALPLMLAPFIAFCVMVGLHWSIKSKGTISSVISAVAIVLTVAGVLSLCAAAAGRNITVIGSTLVAASPINLVFAVVYPARTITDALNQSPAAARASLVIGAALAAAAYAALVYGMHANMKRTFMMTVRKLAGTN